MSKKRETCGLAEWGFDGASVTGTREQIVSITKRLGASETYGDCFAFGVDAGKADAAARIAELEARLKPKPCACDHKFQSHERCGCPLCTAPEHGGVK